MKRAAGAVLLGIALVVSAASFDTPSLYVPGAALAGLGIGAATWVWLASLGARVERELGPDLVEEEQGWPLRLEFRGGLVAPPGGELVEPLVGRPLPLWGRRSRRARVQVTFGRRGRRALEPPRCVVRDPLGLARREIPSPPGREVLVLPRVEPVLGPAGGDASASLGALAHQRAAGADEVELDGLRPHRQGAPAARIHWPTVARTGELVERRLIPDVGDRPLVVLDARAVPSEDALDMAVRAAASLTVRLARAGGCAVLLPGDRRPVDVEPDLRAWPGVHVRLALLGPDPRPPAIGRLARPGPILWVASSPGARLPRELARAGGARYLVAPGAPAAGAAFAVAGCTGVVLARGRRAGAQVAGEAA